MKRCMSISGDGRLRAVPMTVRFFRNKDRRCVRVDFRGHAIADVSKYEEDALDGVCVCAGVSLLSSFMEMLVMLCGAERYEVRVFNDGSERTPVKSFKWEADAEAIQIPVEALYRTVQALSVEFYPFVHVQDVLGV